MNLEDKKMQSIERRNEQELSTLTDKLNIANALNEVKMKQIENLERTLKECFVKIGSLKKVIWRWKICCCLIFLFFMTLVLSS